MTSTNRRHALHLLAAAAGMATLPAMAAAPAKIAMEVWKDPNCGCCKDWIALMEQAGFAVKVHDVGNSAVRAKLGLPTRLGSCHTALVGGYLVEGHVPAADVHKLLNKNPRRWASPYRACPSAVPAWTAPSTAAAKTPTTCCWSPKA